MISKIITLTVIIVNRGSHTCDPIDIPADRALIKTFCSIAALARVVTNSLTDVVTNGGAINLVFAVASSAHDVQMMGGARTDTAIASVAETALDALADATTALGSALLPLLGDLNPSPCAAFACWRATLLDPDKCALQA